MICLLPYGNDRPVTRFPAVTYALISSNVLAFLWMMQFDRVHALYGMGLIPSQPSFTNILSSMFVHADFLHLAWNMFFLWMFGPNVEDALGRVEYAIFYFGSGFAAALLHVVVALQFTPSAAGIPMVGASGAIAGILGIFAIRFYRTRIRIWFIFFTVSIPAWIGLGIWFLRQLSGGVNGLENPQSGDVAYWSHIGGMIFGMLLAYALRMGREGTKEYLMTDAQVSLDQGTTWGAAECLLSLLKSDPENADVHRELARTYAMQQHPEQSIVHYRRSIDLFLRKGLFEKAAESYAQLKHHYPKARLSLRSEYRLARFLADAGICEPALELLECIISSHPGTPEAETSLVKAGDIHLNSLDNPRIALHCYERFLREYPLSTYRGLVEKSLADARARLDNASHPHT